MSRNVCCVPGCPPEEGTVLHYFPHPVKDAERFQNWVKFIGGDLAELDSATIRKSKRICRRHFHRQFLYPRNRLNKLAVPSLLLFSPELSDAEQAMIDEVLNEEIMESPILFCICCLSKGGRYIQLSTCSHSEFLNRFLKPEIEPRCQVICYNCHNMLKKIKMFTQQVLNSFNIIAEESDIQVTHQQNRNLQIHKQENIDIPQTNVIIDNNINQSIDNEEVTNETPQRSFKQNSSEMYERKMKNIGNALEIINSNQNNACINLLATSLNSLSNSLINKNMDFINIPILNIGTVSQDTDTSKAANSSNILLEAMKTADIEDSFGVQEVELSSDRFEKEEEVPNEVQKIVKPSKNVLKSSIQSRIKAIILSEEELMTERSKSAAGQRYLKAPYKCETCILGFNYRENLEDHSKRKHCYKENLIKCDVCLQYIDPGANYSDHISYHYIRYECLTCGRRYHSEDQTMFHYRRNHIKATKYTCLHCSYNMTSYRHIKLGSEVKQNNKIKIYKCLRCKMTWKNVEQNSTENVLQADVATVEEG
ncbi:unnamed protein product [Spodoptera littoralis]|uniref:Uncharacterized protein n=1 Tax=Spodoptera littoralis TaxID=7109 RepID=A0A9P0N545_SPOLI|nr:unnamed protein product [Spodoptera littoralis]CAH1642768.1 unnamed protein product [Spodoptera littoralis]